MNNTPKNSESNQNAPATSDEEARRQIARLTRRSFATGGVAGAIGLGAFAWLRNAIDPKVDGSIPWPLRRVLEFNENVAKTVFGVRRLAPEFPRSAAGEPKANGDVGLGANFRAADWSLQTFTLGKQAASFDLAAIRNLPRVEMTTQLNCVEGWSQVVHWAGARFSDFLAANRLGTRSGEPLSAKTPASDLYPYVRMATPDEKYFVGLDMPSAIHPQTLLCYEMNGEPLTAAHGAPLRLVITVKYGIKNIKRIGSIRFLEDRPHDYWGDRGYDWFAGL